MRKLTALVVCFAAAALAGAWRIETVDEVDTDSTSIAIDSSDCPHIAYQGDMVLRYASLDNEQWHDELVDDEYGVTGIDPSLVFNSLDRPCISYTFWYAECGAKYAEWNGEQWILRGLLSDCWGNPYTSLALDVLDRPHVAAGMDYFLCYIYWDGAHWQYEWDYDIESGNVSLILDSSDHPHITYYWSEPYNECLKYRYWNGSNWQVFTLDGGGRFNSLALDSAGRMHVAYYNNNANLCYIYDIDNKETVDYIGDVGREADLALDSQDRPHISYFDADNDTIKYAHWDGSQWLVETVAPTDGNWYGFASIAVDSNDLPHISYMGLSDYLMYARWDPNGFHLLEPEKGEVITTLTPLLNWEDSPVPGHESYILWWGTDPDFETYNEVTGIDDSEYQITDGIDDGDRIYWRVKSVAEGEEYWSVDMDWYFDVDLGGGVDIVDFGAGATDEGILINWRLSGEEPAGVCVLRGADEPEVISGNLPGDSSRYLDRDVEPGGSYAYWLEVVEADGTVERFGPTEAVTLPEEMPELALYAAYPSPSREVVNFAYSLPADGRVVLSVFDLSGRRVATVLDAETTAGRHEVSWNCAEIPSGVYLYRLETSSGSLTQRLVVSR